MRLHLSAWKFSKQRWATNVSTHITISENYSNASVSLSSVQGRVTLLSGAIINSWLCKQASRGLPSCPVKNSPDETSWAEHWQSYRQGGREQERAFVHHAAGFVRLQRCTVKTRRKTWLYSLLWVRNSFWWNRAIRVGLRGAGQS